MTLDKIAERIHDTISKSGHFKIYLILNAYTLHSLVRDIAPYLDQVTPPVMLEQGESARIFGYPAYINGQVPNDEVYVMYGDRPLNPPCTIWYGDNAD